MAPSIESGIAGWLWYAVCHGQSRDRQDGAALKLLPIILLVIVAVSAVLQPTQAMPVKEVRRILVFNDFDDIASPGVSLLDRAIFTALSESRYQIEWYSENLGATLFSDETSQRRIREWYIRKYEDRKPDLIVAVGPMSLQFMVDSHKKFFPGVPIIFCGSSEEMLEKLKPDSHFTGVWGVAQPDETLKAALRLKPDTKHVVVVGGVGAYDRYVEALVKRGLRVYESRFDVTYLTDLDMPTLLERLGNLPNNTIVLFTSVVQDAAGERFVDATQANPVIARAANAPIFVLFDVDLGTGTVGGDLISFASDGKIAGDIAMRILNGEKPQNIPIVKNANVFTFDWRALRRWGLKEGDLPAGSIVLNRTPTFWQAYKQYVSAAFFVLLAQSVAIFALFWQRAQRRKTQTELKKSEEKFSKAFQRSPLAFTLASLVDYRFVEVNDTFERYTGWSRDEVIGRTPLQIKFWVDISQRSIFLEGLRAQGAVQNMKILFRRKDGEPRTGMLSSELIHVNGEPCALSLIADITEASRAESARRESEERFRLVANTAPVMIRMSGPDKLCNYFSQPWLDFRGQPLEAELGNGWWEGVHPEDFKSCVDTYVNSFDRHETFRMQYRLRRHDGEYRWVSDIGVPRFEPDGSFAGYIGSCIDVTDHKLAEEALANVGRRLIQAHEEERTWIARELHDDINQRLALLAIELEQFKEKVPEAVPSHEHLSELQRQVSDIGKDVQSLSHRLHSSKLDYLGLAAAVSSFCRELSTQNKVEIDFTHSGIPRSLPNEISLCLFRVLQEALQNAVKHSGTRHFEVELHGKAEKIELTVRDRGEGFDVEAAAHRLGLGLISMGERVSLVKGTMLIASTPKGGTEIKVRVPLTASAAAFSSEERFRSASTG